MDCPYGKRVARRFLGKTVGSAVAMRPRTGHCPRFKLRAMRWLRPKCCNAATHRTLPGVQVLVGRRRDLLLHLFGARRRVLGCPLLTQARGRRGGLNEASCQGWPRDGAAWRRSGAAMRRQHGLRNCARDERSGSINKRALMATINWKIFRTGGAHGGSLHNSPTPWTRVRHAA